eukprot:10124825-Ditylum_brightwellii.AAC.1
MMQPLAWFKCKNMYMQVLEDDCYIPRNFYYRFGFMPSSYDTWPQPICSKIARHTTSTSLYTQMLISDSITPFFQDNDQYESLPEFVLLSMKPIASDAATAGPKQFTVDDLFGKGKVHDVVAKVHNHVMEEI